MEICNYGDTIYIHEHKWYRKIKPTENIEIGGVTGVTGIATATTSVENNELYVRKENKKITALYDVHPRESLSNKLLVNMECTDKNNKKKIRLFTVFENYLEFANYEKKFDPKERCFFETIIGEHSQKPHFDIDIPVNTGINPESVKDVLIDSLIDVMKEIGVELDLSTDICIFTSHGNDKYSYHIIVNNYCCANHKEAKEIYNRCMKKIDVKKINNNHDEITLIDPAVYSSLQQFRMVGSRKQGTERIKILSEKWMYENETIVYKYIEEPENPYHKHILELDVSLVSVTSSCQYLPTLLLGEQDDKIKSTDYEEIDMETAKLAMEMLANYAGVSQTDAVFPFKLMGINGGLVLLKRKRPSNCSQCGRVHHNENAFLMIIGEEKSILYN